MKKFLVVALALLFTICCAATFSACNSGKKNDGNDLGIKTDSEIKQYNENITYKLSYASYDECPDGNFDDEYLHTTAPFQTGKVFYAVVDFTISSFNAEGWDNTYNVSIKISPKYSISASLEEAKTSNFKVEEDSNCTTVTTIYSVPENRAQQRKDRVVVRLAVNEMKNLTVGVAFYGDNQFFYDYSEQSKVLESTEGVEFILNDNKQSYTANGRNIANVLFANGYRVLLVDYYNGLPVTGIEGFNGKNFSSILLPEKLQYIYYSAFNGCEYLSDIKLPDSVTSIGQYAFHACSSLESLTLPNEVTSIGEGAFIGCTGLESIVIPDSVTSIGSNAFQNCTSLTDVKLSNNLRTISYQVFERCSNLTDITIPESVVDIRPGAFNECTSLKNVYFEDPSGWKVKVNFLIEFKMGISRLSLSSSKMAARMLRKTYCENEWFNKRRGY